MNEYYKIMSDSLSNDFEGDGEKATIKKNKIIQLCDQGLSRACLDYFAILIIEDQNLRINPNTKKYTKSENQIIIALGNKIISQGETKGYGLLGIYYYIIGKKEKAMQQYKLGAKMEIKWLRWNL